METSPVICSANQWTGFYMITASLMKELRKRHVGIILLLQNLLLNFEKLCVVITHLNLYMLLKLETIIVYINAGVTFNYTVPYLILDFKKAFTQL